MYSIHLSTAFSIFVGVLFVFALQVQRSSGTLASPARSLDALLQDYAYRSLDQPSTGKIYSVGLRANITSGISVSVVRFRSGSFRTRGIWDFHEFSVPAGVSQRTFVLRIALVYHNLGNWSSVYYSLPGYTFLTPVVGLLAYDATNLSATNLPELDLVAPKKPITINFTHITSPGSFGGSANYCAYFYLNGSHGIGELTPGSNVCTTYSQGHFAVVVNYSTAEPVPSPSPAVSGKSKFKTWEIVVLAIGGFLVLALLVLLVVRLRKHQQKEKRTDMLRHAEDGEVLSSQKVGSALLPVASMVRTRPVLENDYVP